MVIVKIMGGVGNQLFQYAIGKSIAIKHNEKLILDISWCNKNINEPHCKFQLNLFNTDYEILNPSVIQKIYIKMFEIMYYHLPKLYKLSSKYFHHVSENFAESYNTPVTDIDNAYLIGYWCNEKYFLDIKDTILNDFQPVISLNEASRVIDKKISSCSSVCVHIRRGDYVSKYSDFFELCSVDYYLKGAEYIHQRIHDAVFFVFSDDIPWAKANLNIPYEHYFVDINDEDNGIYDLILMMHCKHFITANSSFSWWAAWLSQSPEKIVIRPTNYLKDKSSPVGYPKEWIVMKSI